MCDPVKDCYTHPIIYAGERILIRCKIPRRNNNNRKNENANMGWHPSAPH